MHLVSVNWSVVSIHLSSAVRNMKIALDWFPHLLTVGNRIQTDCSYYIHPSQKCIVVHWPFCCVCCKLILFSYILFSFLPLFPAKGRLAVCGHGGWSTLPLDLCHLHHRWNIGHFRWCQFQCYSHWPLHKSLNLVLTSPTFYTPQHLAVCYLDTVGYWHLFIWQMLL